jgi:2-polyprenyl-6-methoxyphenol hydroxylase-like FAD-dependent oxidoreductase
LGVMSNLGKRYSYPLMRQRSSLLNSERTVVIGNAANVVHPNGAQGLNLGFRDVATLLTVIKRSGENSDTKAILEQYASLRLKDHRMTGRFTDLMAQGSRSSLNTLVILRRLSMLAFSHSSRLRKRLVQKASGLGLLEQSVDFSLWDQ